MEIRKEVQIAAPFEIAFGAVLEELGPGSQLPDGKPFPMKIEPWVGGGWYRDSVKRAGTQSATLGACASDRGADAFGNQRADADVVPGVYMCSIA